MNAAKQAVGVPSIEQVMVRMHDRPEHKSARCLGTCGGCSGRPTWTPSLDVCESQHETVVMLDLPGIDEDDIQVSLENGTLTVFGSREFNHDHEDAEEYTTLERRYGRFERAITLSRAADPDDITAKYKRGVLHIRIPHRTSADNNSNQEKA